MTLFARRDKLQRASRGTCFSLSWSGIGCRAHAVEPSSAETNLATDSLFFLSVSIRVHPWPIVPLSPSGKRRHP